MSFHVAKIKRASGKVDYRIRYWDNYKHKTVPATEHPEFASLKEAEDFCQQQNAKADADRHLEKHAKGMDQLAWKKKYANFDKDVSQFLEWYAEEAPNSWEACRSWLQNYVIPYFIGKGLNNPNLWHTEFENFRRWLEKEATIYGGRKKPSYSTMGHIVKALNSFLRFLGLHQKMDALTSQIKCRGYRRSKMNKRGKEDLFQPDEYEMLKHALGISSQFYIILMNTGMRIHELYSLPFSNVFKGDKDLDEALKMPFKQLGQKIFGYVRLESQMKLKAAYRIKTTGTIPRKPLKSKPKIAAEYNRIIPIVDEETWNILVENRRRAMKEWEERAYISSKVDDYLLMNVDLNNIRRDMRKYTTKTPHCCRHTYTTNTVKAFRGVNYGPELIKGITGHSSVEFERYVHLGFEDEQEVRKRKVEKF